MSPTTWPVAFALIAAALLGLRAAASDPLHAPAHHLSFETDPTPAPAAPARAPSLAVDPPRMPGPARGRGRPGAAAQNAACESCHPEVAAEWRSSLHHHASTEPSYVRSLAREPSAFCRGCHAPEGDPDRPAREAVRLGVGCVTCHAPEGVVLAGPRSDLSHETAPHALVRSADFAGVSACGGCHEFEFPGQRALMQSTLREHAASTYAALPCAACHMPPVAGGGRRRSHAFVASRDPDVLRQALRARSERPTPTSARLSLGTGTVGHAFPTGDLFRRLVVGAEVDLPRGQRARAQRVLTRHFGVDTRTLLADDRPGAPALAGADVIVELELGEAARGRPIRWWIRYERVAFPRDEGARAELDGALVIAEGVLAAADDQAR